jgi:hypothetical protein
LRRIFGKSKANTYFSFKWYSKPKAIQYVLVLSIVLNIAISSNDALEVMKGVKAGVEEYQSRLTRRGRLR